MSTDEAATPPTLAVPTHDAAAHLLLAVHVSRIVLGRSREPGVEHWVAELRVALTGVLSAKEVHAVLARCQQLERDLQIAA